VTEFVYWMVEAFLVINALRSRRLAIMVLAFSLPFSRRLPAFPVPLLNYQNIIILAALIAYGAHPPGKGSRPGKVFYLVPVTILAIFFTAAFANTVMTFQPRLFWRLWDPYENLMNFKALLTCLALYVLASKAVQEKDDLIAIFRAGVAGILAEAGYSALEYVAFHPGRVTGHMTEPNSLGSFLASGICLCLGILLVIPRKDLLWKIALAGLVVSPVALLGTLSRGSYLAAALGFVILTSLLNRKILVAGVAIAVLSPLWLPQKVTDRFGETFHNEEQESWRFRGGRGREESALIRMIDDRLEAGAADGEIAENDTRLDNSIQIRLIVWESAAKMIWDYPLGIGFGVFPWYMQYYSDIVMWKATHNIYLRVATEAGFPALLVFLALIGFFLRDAFRIGIRSEDPFFRAIGLGMFTYLIALALNALSIDIFFQIDVNGQFWVMMGALLQVPFLRTGTPPPAIAPEVEAQVNRPLYELVR